MLGAILSVKGWTLELSILSLPFFIRQNTQFQGSPVGQQQTSTIRGIAGNSSELNGNKLLCKRV